VEFADKQGLKLFRTSEAQIILTVPHKQGDKEPVDPSSATYAPFLWSPDDRWLLITIGRYEQEGLGFLNTKNGEIVEITSSEQRALTCGFSGATWSPDSSNIIFTSDVGYACEWGQAFPGVNLASPASPRFTSLFTYTLEPEVIAGAGNPTWRPNTDQIVFSQEVFPESNDPVFPDPTFQLYAIRSNGKGAHQLTSNSKGHVYSPTWDASGSRLFYSSRKADNMGDGVYVSRPDGTEPHRLVAGEGIVSISVSPDGNYLVFGPGYAATPFFSKAPSWSDEIWVLDLRTEEVLLSGSGKFVGWQMRPN
jgi:Tol biopolymer transport system component